MPLLVSVCAVWIQMRHMASYSKCSAFGGAMWFAIMIAIIHPHNTARSDGALTWLTQSSLADAITQRFFFLIAY